MLDVVDASSRAAERRAAPAAANVGAATAPTTAASNGRGEVALIGVDGQPSLDGLFDPTAQVLVLGATEGDAAEGCWR